MKRTAVLFLFVLIMSLSLYATTYTIGTNVGSSHEYPFEGFYEYSWCKIIVTKAQINDAGLTGPSNLFSIGLHVDISPQNYVMHDQRIYVRHTTASSEDNAYPGTAGFTQVFTDDVLYNETGWKTFDFSVPFFWDNVRNLEILFENHDGTWENEYPYFSYCLTANGMNAYLYQDAEFPTTSGWITNQRPIIQLSTGSDLPPNPAVAINPLDGSDGIEPTVSLSWASGGNIPTGYRLYFGTTPAPSLVGDLGLATSWTPPSTLATSTTYYWKVVPYNTLGDASGCPVWSFTTRNEYQVVIGNGATQLLTPVVAYLPYSYSQTIYYQSEMASPHHIINSLSYYWTGPAGTNSNNWDIYLGNVGRTFFSSSTDFVPLDSLTLVFSGIVDLPSTSGWITINLTTPFTYNPARNLVIAVDENAAGSDDPNGAFLGEDAYVSRSLIGINISYPVNPAVPAGTTSSKFTTDTYNNVRIGFAYDTPATPVVTISKSSSTVDLSWPAVSGAAGYYIWYSADPYAASYNLLGFISGTSTSVEPYYDKMFFKVTASTDAPSK